MKSSQAELAIFIFLGVFCVLCPLLVFISWYFWGDDEIVEPQPVKKPSYKPKKSFSEIKSKRSHLEIVIEESATSSEESGATTVEVAVLVGDEEEGTFCNSPRKNPMTPKPKEIICVKQVSAGSGATSSKVATIDVHRCNSSYCQLCNKPHLQEIQFIHAEPLEASTVHKMRYLPNRWWEMGAPLRDLTNSITSVFATPALDHDVPDDDKSLFSRWSRKIRKTHPKTPRTPRGGLKLYQEGVEQSYKLRVEYRYKSPRTPGGRLKTHPEGDEYEL
jgi:hypothetical protein